MWLSLTGRGNSGMIHWQRKGKRMGEILFESNRGIVFEKTVTRNRCKVVVKNKDGNFTHMTYRYNNGVEPLSSPYISWENLNCCGGWSFDESYLQTAVQEGKKLCAGITFNNGRTSPH